MNESKYYEFLNSLPPHTVNKHGWVVANIMPFYDSGPAVKYVLDHYPEAKPSDHLIALDPVRCRELAIVMLAEFKYLGEQIEKQREAAREKIDENANKRDAIEVKSIADQVEKEVLQSVVLQWIGVHTGLIDAKQMIAEREMELWTCGRLKDERV